MSGPRARRVCFSELHAPFRAVNDAIYDGRKNDIPALYYSYYIYVRPDTRSGGYIIRKYITYTYVPRVECSESNSPTARRGEACVYHDSIMYPTTVRTAGFLMDRKIFDFRPRDKTKKVWLLFPPNVLPWSNCLWTDLHEKLNLNSLVGNHHLLTTTCAHNELRCKRKAKSFAVVDMRLLTL